MCVDSSSSWYESLNSRYIVFKKEWEVNTFLLKIGGGTSEYADKFDNIKEIFTLNSVNFKIL